MCIYSYTGTHTLPLLLMFVYNHKIISSVFCLGYSSTQVSFQLSLKKPKEKVSGARLDGWISSYLQPCSQTNTLQHLGDGVEVFLRSGTHWLAFPGFSGNLSSETWEESLRNTDVLCGDVPHSSPLRNGLPMVPILCFLFLVSIRKLISFHFLSLPSTPSYSL